MTYRELYEKATTKLEKSEITLGEYEKMTKALDREIGTCKNCEYWNGENGAEHGICDVFTNRDRHYTSKAFYCGSFERSSLIDGSN